MGHAISTGDLLYNEATTRFVGLFAYSNLLGLFSLVSFPFIIEWLKDKKRFFFYSIGIILLNFLFSYYANSRSGQLIIIMLLCGFVFTYILTKLQIEHIFARKRQENEKSLKDKNNLEEIYKTMQPYIDEYYKYKDLSDQIWTTRISITRTPTRTPTTRTIRTPTRIPIRTIRTPTRTTSAADMADSKRGARVRFRAPLLCKNSNI